MINYDRGLCTGAAVLASAHDRAARQAEAQESGAAHAAADAAAGRAQPRRARPHGGGGRGPLRAAATARTAARCSIRRARPARNACRTRLEWRDVDGRRRADLPDTVLHHRNELYFRERVPWRLGTVRLDAGPSVIVASARRLRERAVARARAHCTLDRSGPGGAHRAAGEGHARTWRTIRMLREMTSDPKFRKVLVTDGKSAVGPGDRRRRSSRPAPTSCGSASPSRGSSCPASTSLRSCRRSRSCRST